MKKTLLVIVIVLAVLGVIGGLDDTDTSLPHSPEISIEENLADKKEKEESSATDENEKTPLTEDKQSYIPALKASAVDLKNIPAYSGKAYVAVNNNIPYFTDEEHTTTSFEKYSYLDSLGRCGVAFANIGVDIMPTEERDSIGSVKPSGWHTVKYENVDGKYLYNRCHLIGYQLSGENANEKNLITGTRYMNVNGMLPFENMVADYVKETKNHVLYRVTPIFEGNNLLATGVLMEALSMEDNGDGICFNVFCYNEQPGITINHTNGDSKANETLTSSAPKTVSPTAQNEPSNNYIANKNTQKFHYTHCSSVKKMKEENKKYLSCTRDQAISQGYSPCGNCNP